MADDGRVPAGLILLVGPPASGQSSFARAWVDCGRLDADEVLVRRNSARSGHARVPTDGVRHYATIAGRQTSRDQLLAEGATTVVDVPGEAEGFSPARAAAAIPLS
jgi:predicted kinase